MLADKGMVTSNTKEQFYSPHKGVLDLWRSTHPTYLGQAANRSKDLGSTQRGLNVHSALRVKRIYHLKSKAQRVKTLKSGKVSKLIITRVGLHTSTLFLGVSQTHLPNRIYEQ